MQPGRPYFDADMHPTSFLTEPDDYFIFPEKDYELVGEVNNVCFVEGHGIFSIINGFLYYGTGDSKIAVAVSESLEVVNSIILQNDIGHINLNEIQRMKIKTAEFVISNTDVSICPKDKLPEYAFIGRSNVGKSSLINMLTNHKSLAKTSGKPGKTQLINHFIINQELVSGGSSRLWLCLRFERIKEETFQKFHQRLFQ